MSAKTFNVKVDEVHEYKITDGEIAGLNIVRNEDGSLHIIDDVHRSYAVIVHHVDLHTKTIALEINGNQKNIRIKDSFDDLIQKLGLNATGSQKMKELKAPMPGLVLKIEASAGQAVTQGDVLVVLEAMKMENALKAVSDAVVKEIKVTAGQAVDKGAVLITFE